MGKYVTRYMSNSTGVGLGAVRFVYRAGKGMRFVLAGVRSVPLLRMRMPWIDYGL